MPSDQDVVLSKVLDHLVRGMKRVHHDEIRMRVDRLQSTRHRLVEEFLPIIGVVLNKVADSVGIIESGHGSLRS